jgi:hypothetical protein
VWIIVETYLSPIGRTISSENSHMTIRYYCS